MIDVPEYTLINGDCLEVLTVLDAGSFDAVVTDPPYGKSLKNNAGKNGNGRIVRDYTIAGDENQAVGIAALKLLAGRPLVVFADPLLPWPGKWRQALVWDKGGAVGGGGDIQRCWKYSWEMIQIANTGIISGARDSSVLRFWVTPQSSAEHPATKPVKLMVYLVEKITSPGDTILDPFMGSGTTGEACLRTGRRFVGIEIDPEYFEIASRRLADVARELRGEWKPIKAESNVADLPMFGGEK